jgi:hypothetical protein
MALAYTTKILITLYTITFIYIYIFSLKTIYYRGKENKHIANGQGYGYLCNEDILVFL